MVLNRLRSLSPIDALAGVVALAALAGVVWSPKLSNAVAKATGAVKPVQVSVDVVRLYSADPEQLLNSCLLYTSPSPRDLSTSRMPSSA